MAKVNQLLTNRFKKTEETSSKMNALAALSSTGGLSSFSGIFRVETLSDTEQQALNDFLSTFSTEGLDIREDARHLCLIVSEVKAINNQAAILHGERIKRASEILKKYKQGAFSAWLIQTYGNRQTPYNFLQYYELYVNLSKTLQEKVEAMPRQAVYTLATRKCSLEQKEAVIKNYQGEGKEQLLSLIREKFPLKLKDKRSSSPIFVLLKHLHQFENQLKSQVLLLSIKEKKQLQERIQSVYTFLLQNLKR